MFPSRILPRRRGGVVFCSCIVLGTEITKRARHGYLVAIHPPIYGTSHLPCCFRHQTRFFFPLGAFFSCALRQTNASAEEKAEALSDVDDEFAGRQQQLETRTVQVLYTEHGNLKYHSPQVPP